MKRAPGGPKRLYTYSDLETFPEDNVRREIIDGELFETSTPWISHQQVVMNIAGPLWQYALEHGGEVYPPLTDVFFSDTDVVEPDVLFVRADHLDKVEERFVRSAPDLVVEVSSPSTRKLELVHKRKLYERFGVPEYWFVDLESDLIQVYRLADGYGLVHLLGRDDTIEALSVPGFTVAVDEILGEPEEGESS